MERRYIHFFSEAKKDGRSQGMPSSDNWAAFPGTFYSLFSFLCQQRSEATLAQKQSKRPHVYELDPLRICTALSVVAVHVLFFTAYLNSSETGYQMQNALVVTFHFTREVFVFVTAFALVYVYNGRSISPFQFWKKRALGVVFPYIVWSIIYVLVNTPFSSPGTFFQTTFFDILTGNASYQLYYILLTIQFYLIFPLCLPFIRACARRPWIALAVSFILQVVFFFIDYHTIQNSSQPFWQTVSTYQDRFFLVYQFYFLLGGLTALYFQQVRAFVLRHGNVILGASFCALAALWLHFMLQVRVDRESISYASSVLQPIMVFYSVAIIFFALWLACCWVGKSQQGKRPRGYRFWHTLSDASFGVYLIHALLLTAVLRWLLPALPTSWFEPVRVFLAWLITAGGSLAISILLTRLPVVSRLVGRDASSEKARTRSIDAQQVSKTANFREPPSPGKPQERESVWKTIPDYDFPGR
jgi:peptidoglycan/LPS O-acetylase OafA/YrhL